MCGCFRVDISEPKFDAPTRPSTPQCHPSRRYVKRKVYLNPKTIEVARRILRPGDVDYAKVNGK